MKKFLLALTAVAAFSGSAFAADLPARTYTKAPDDAGRLRAGPASTSSAAAAAASGMPTPASRQTATGAASAARSTSRAAMAGSARSAPATTGSSTAAGSSASWPTASSAASRAIRDLGWPPRRQREASGYLGGGRSRRLSGCAERSFLCQRAVIPVRTGRARLCLTRSRSRPSGFHTDGFTSERLVRRRRRRKQPEHLRHHRAGLVHEDRISRCLLRQQEPRNTLADGTNLPVGLLGQLQRRAGADHQHLAGLPLQLGWPGRRQVLI